MRTASERTGTRPVHPLQIRFPMWRECDKPESRRLSRWLLLLVVLAPVAFATITGNIWEDFLITFRSSLNLVHGASLVYEVGRRVHVFTSPLGTLVPAGISWLLRTDDPVAVLNVFRGTAVVALGLAWWLTAPRLPGLLAVAVAGSFWALDAKLAAFSTNGMETAFLVFFVMLAWRALAEGNVNWAGIALGGAMWTRPDGFVFVGAVAAGFWLFPGDRRYRWRDWIRVAAIAGLIYGPWLVWAWMYYGSPVPNTILAKGAQLNAREAFRLLWTYPFRLVFGHCAAHDAFLPSYYFFGGWSDRLWWYGKALALAAAGTVLWPRCDRAARAAGLAFVLGGLYLGLTTRAPWYFPAWQILAYVAVAGGVAAMREKLAQQPVGRLLLGGLVTAGLAVQAWLFVCTVVQLRAQQEIIEWGLRAPIGRALRQAARSPRETVFLEPLGYIGFYSGLAMRDTPGLCAPEVVTLRKAGRISGPELIAAVQPDWTIMRGGDYVAMNPPARQAFEKDYVLWAVGDMRQRVSEIAWLPGREFLLFDAHYLVWRRRVPAAMHP